MYYIIYLYICIYINYKNKTQSHLHLRSQWQLLLKTWTQYKHFQAVHTSKGYDTCTLTYQPFTTSLEHISTQVSSFKTKAASITGDAQGQDQPASQPASPAGPARCIVVTGAHHLWPNLSFTHMVLTLCALYSRELLSSSQRSSPCTYKFMWAITLHCFPVLARQMWSHSYLPAQRHHTFTCLALHCPHTQQILVSSSVIQTRHEQGRLRDLVFSQPVFKTGSSSL